MRAEWLARYALPGLALVAGGALAAQPPARPPFDPFPGGIAASYHFDLARNFFRTPEQEAAEWRLVEARLARLDSLARGAVRSADALLGALRLQDSLDLEVQRHAAYLELRYDADTRQEEARAASARLLAAAGRPYGTFAAALRSLADDDLARLERERPELRRYRFALDGIRGSAAPRLEPAAQRVVGALAPHATGWGAQLFAATVASTDFGTVATPAGELSVSRDYAALAASPDRRVRREGYQRNERGLAQHREVYAAILTRTAAALDAVSRARGWPDHPSESYAGRYLDRARVVALLDSLAAAAEVNRRFERAVVEHQRRTLALDTVHTWDLSVPEPGVTLPRFTITEATRLVLDATRPLGADYARELALLLDPTNGRLDVAPAPYRVSRQGFSTGLVGFPSTFYQGAFAGYVEDVVTLAHESGHAVQNMLMTAGGVLPRYAAGPAYFTESFAGLSELLVLEALYRRAPDRAHRIYWLQRLVAQGAGVFRNGWESRLEQQLFDSVAAGRRPGADDIEAMTQATAARYSVWFGPGSERRLAWVQPTQFYTRPLYRINYVYANLLALRYLDLLHRDPSAFARRYGALLGNGYDAPPDALLRRFVDTRLDDPALVRGAARVLASWVEELERLYAS